MAIAALVGVLLAPSASAGIATSGNVSTVPGGVPIGPGDTISPATSLYVLGGGGVGTLTADDGSQLHLSSLTLGDDGGSGEGRATLSGAGTTLALFSPGSLGNPLNRLEVGNWGRGTLRVQDGARIEGRANAAACVGVDHFCNSFIGNGAGADGSLTVTGVGSTVELLSFLGVANPSVFRPPFVDFTFGTPGAATLGTLRILDGGALSTDSATLALGPSGEVPLGTERSFASAIVDGSGSIWRVTGGTANPSDPALTMATHSNATADLMISNGGALEIGNVGYPSSFFAIAQNGGRGDVIVDGAGSRIAFTDGSGTMHIGESGGTATVTVRNGGAVEHPRFVRVGHAGGIGTLALDGPTTQLLVDAHASDNTRGAPGVNIGAGGLGFATLDNGAQLDIVTTERHDNNGPFMLVGWEPASTGSIAIRSGSVVHLSSESVAPGSADEAFNPFVGVGFAGSGSLEISSGGKLFVDGRAISTSANPRFTGAQIGRGTENATSGHGRLSVSGAGSELRIRGNDGFIEVGTGIGGSGELSVSDGALVETLSINLGVGGGTGIARVDNARVEMVGEWAAIPFGPGILIGGGEGSVGNLSLTNGSVLHIENTVGSKGGGIALGGLIGGQSGGDGTLTLSASRIESRFRDDLGSITVAYDGSALVRLRDASSIDLGAASLLIAQTHGADGTVIATGNSTITAGWVGVGRDRDALGNTFDGGTATLLLRDSTLTATDIVIGTNGFLTGCNAVINGNVTNFGGFSPGCSPGLFTINGDYIAEAGSRLILEVESDGTGGFRTDDLRFAGNGVIDLGELHIEYRFLGDTNPLLFQQSGLFDINTFLHRVDTIGMLQLLDPALFDNVDFSARSDVFDISNFSYNIRDGAMFTTNAHAVATPASLALLLLGVAVAGMSGRRSRLND